MLGSTNFTNGGARYPLPGRIIRNSCTACPNTNTLANAPDPVSIVITTDGATLKPDPGWVIVNPVIAPVRLLIIGVAAGEVPDPRSPLNETVVPCPYPFPPLTTLMFDNTLVVVRVTDGIADSAKRTSCASALTINPTSLPHSA